MYGRKCREVTEEGRRATLTVPILASANETILYVFVCISTLVLLSLSRYLALLFSSSSFAVKFCDLSEKRKQLVSRLLPRALPGVY